jgi:hypothetical protein
MLIAADSHLDYRDSLPGFVITRIKSRLGVSPIKVEVMARDPKDSDDVEILERWYRGVHSSLDPIGAIDGQIREGQAADGVGFLEIDPRPMHVGPRDDGSSNYLDKLEQSRMDYGLCVSANSPDPRSIYYLESRGDLSTTVKVVNVPLVDVTNAYNMHDFKVAWDGNKFQKRYLLGEEQPPMYTSAEYGHRVRMVIIADGSYIYHCMYPIPSPIMVGLDPVLDSPGSVPDLELLHAYPNPMGRPNVFWAPARSTNHPDPAFRHQPLAMELLDLAPYINTWRETRMIAGRKAAMAPTILKPDVPDEGPPANNPEQQGQLDWSPGFIKFSGVPLTIPGPDMADFDKFDATLSGAYNAFNQSIVSLATSGAIGGRTPAWSIMQFNEEFNSLIQESINSRSYCWQQALEGVGKLAQAKYGVTGKVYVYGPRVRSEQSLMVGADAKLLSIPHKVMVSIPALSQGQKAALREYAAILRDEGTISQETYENMIGVEDRIAEKERKDFEALSAPLTQLGRSLGQSIAITQLREAYGPVVDVVLGALGASPAAQGAGPPVRGGMMDRLHTPGNGMNSEVQEPGQRTTQAESYASNGRTPP